MPELLICSKITDADKCNTIQTKEDDLILERGDGSGAVHDDDEDAEEDEDFTSGRGGSLNTTLRKSAAYTLAAFSKSFQDETYSILQPCIEKAIAKQIVVPN